MEIWDFESIKPFPNTIKWIDCQMDPIGFCFAEFLQGINTLAQNNSKTVIKFLVLIFASEDISRIGF